MVSKFDDLLGTQDTKVCQAPQVRQVTEVGQDTEAIEDTKVSQVPQERQVTELGQDTKGRQDPRFKDSKCLLQINKKRHQWQTTTET